MVRLAAASERAAAAAKVASVLFDHAAVVAFRADLGVGVGIGGVLAGAVGGLVRGLGAGRGRGRDGSGGQSVVFDEPQLFVAEGDQARHVGDGARVVLLFARFWVVGEKVAERFGVVGELAQFHGDPCGVPKAHVEGEQAGERVQALGVVAGEEHFVGPHGAVGQARFFKSEREAVAGGGVVDRAGPGEGAAGQGELGFRGEEGAACGSLGAAAPLEALDAIPDQIGHGGGAGGGFAPAFAGQGVLGLGSADRAHFGELHGDPFGVVQAQVQGEGFGAGAEQARLARSVDPGFEGPGLSVLFGFADEQLNLPPEVSTMEHQAMLPAGNSGRRVPQSSASTGLGGASNRVRKLAAPAAGAQGSDAGSAASVVRKTLPRTALGR